MKYRRFGKAGWQISPLSLGTVELGLDYGIFAPGEPRRPTEKEAVRLLLSAFEEGINLVDTASRYGASEALIGAALREWQDHVYVATKVAGLDTCTATTVQAVKKAAIGTIEESLRRLGRDRVDLVQIHSATASDLREGVVLEALLDAKRQGKVEHVGVSVYETDAAMEALRHSGIAALQVAYNLLDTRMATEVFPEAAARDVAILVRSALLKGVLTERHRVLPASLLGLRQAAERAQAWADALGDSLPEAAIRFCLCNDHVASVLVGARNVDELRFALTAATKPPIGKKALVAARALTVGDEALVDPRTWEID